MKSPGCQFSFKLPVLAGVMAVVLGLCIGTARHGSIPDAWKMIHIPANSPSFSDAQCLTSAADSLRLGMDPYVADALDPFHRLYNYPPVWLTLRYLGVTSASTPIVGLMFTIAAIIGYLLLFNSRSLLTAVIIFLAVVSRCVLFAAERGNNDQMVFFFLVAGVFLIHLQRPELRARLTSLLLIFLTILKVYPVAAVTIFLERRRGWIRAAVTTVAAIAALALTSGSKLAAVVANTPRDSNQSFGTFPFFYSIGSHTLRWLVPVIVEHRSAAPFAALLAGGACMLAGASFRHRLDRFLPPLDSDQARGTIAIACLSIFCFAFVAGSSYDYRLLYLNGVLAWLVEDIDTHGTRRSLPAALLILILLWKPFRLSMAGELADGLVFLMSTLWLGNTLFFRRKVAEEIWRASPATRRSSSFAPPVR